MMMYNKCHEIKIKFNDSKNKLYFYLVFIIFINIFFWVDLYAQGVIFITSDPYKANVFLDGKEVGKTPCLLTNIDLGNHKVVIKKENFQTFVQDIKIEKEGVYKVSANLVPLYFSFFVPSSYYIISENGVKIEAPFIASYVSNGLYSIVLKDKEVKIKKINLFSYGKWLTLGIGLLSVASSFAINVTPYDYDEINTVKSIYLTKGLLLGSGIMSMIFSVIFFVIDFNSQKANVNITFIPYQYKESESEVYAKAMFYLNSLKYDDAIYFLTQFFENYPDSKYISDVIYYIAYIYEIKEEYEKALKFYLLLINEYPVYEWYDLTVFSIAKIYYKQKMYSRSIESLRNILFIDEDLVPKELVYLYFFRNCYQLRNVSDKFKKSLGIYFNLFKEYFQNSKFIYEVYYYYALFLIESGNIKEALNLLNFLVSIDNVYKNEAANLIQKYK